ncbi:MAG: phage holin family protein [Anaerolineaceae bacterium]
MGKFILRVLINAVSLYAAVALLSGHIIMQNNQWFAYLALGLIFGFVNALIRPILMVASCPLLIFTLGLGTLLINTLLFLIVGWIGQAFQMGFTIPDQQFWYAFLGALIVSITSFILSRFLVNDKNKD